MQYRNQGRNNNERYPVRSTQGYRGGYTGYEGQEDDRYRDDGVAPSTWLPGHQYRDREGQYFEQGYQGPWGEQQNSGPDRSMSAADRGSFNDFGYHSPREYGSDYSSDYGRRLSRGSMNDDRYSDYNGAMGRSDYGASSNPGYGTNYGSTSARGTNYGSDSGRAGSYSSRNYGSPKGTTYNTTPNAYGTGSNPWSENDWRRNAGTRHGEEAFNSYNNRENYGTYGAGGSGEYGHEPTAWESVKNFFGFGPKNYKRSDARIQEDVSEALYRDPSVDASEIEVDVKEAVVYLKGTVGDRRTKRMAEDCAEKVYGVKDVRNDIWVEDKRDFSTQDSTSTSARGATGSMTSNSEKTSDKSKSRGDRLM